MKSLLILTEAGEGIGFGHYTRCSAIQDFCLKAGMEATILLDLKGQDTLKSQSFEIKNWLQNYYEIGELSKQFQILLIDSYLATAECYSFLAEKFDKLIVIDDYNRIQYKADVIINPNVSFYETDYNNQSAKVVGGENYVILRSVFRERLNDKPAIQNKVNTIAITLGGSDIRNLLPILAKLALSLSENIIIVTGNESLKSALEAQYNTIHFEGFLSAEEMYEVFKGADIVISACGQTLHELASMGKTTIGICIDYDQEPNMNYYCKEGFLMDRIYWNDSSLDTKIISIFRQLENFNLRKEKQTIASHLINDKGLNNIYNVIN
jgi:UDP-2,4-diacetamido-2,4,6-trideoxy-beta-L-altropyranose hydrolase